MIDQGGYEGNATLITRDAEEKIRQDVAELFRTLSIA